MKRIFSVAPDDRNQRQLKNVNLYRNLFINTSLGLILTLAMSSSPVTAAPTGGNVAQGNAAIAVTNKTTSITQATPRAVIDWNGFNVASDENVTFKVPDQYSATLNNISGGQTQINGLVTSNGTLYFVNKNGFVFGAKSSVTASNLIIATQEIDRGQFYAGISSNLERFLGDINPNATIKLNGAIEAQNYGVVAVFGPNIETGQGSLILTHKGDVVLASGIVKFIDIGGAGGLRFETESPDAVSVYRKLDDGVWSPRFRDPFNFTVKNAGKIEALGGHVTLSAKGADLTFNFASIYGLDWPHEPYAINSLVENTGSIDARAIESKPPHNPPYATGGFDGQVSLISTHGLINLGVGKDGKAGTILSGWLVFNQGAKNADINITDDFLHRIDFRAGKTLDFYAGRDILVRAEMNAPINASINAPGLSNFTLKAAEGIYLLAPIAAGAVSLSSQYVEAHAAIKTDAGGLAVKTSGKKWGKNTYGIWLDAAVTTQNGGDIVLNAENGGSVKLNKDVSGNNIAITTNNGNIELYGASLNAASENVTHGNITLTLNGKGNLRVDNAITAHNLVVTTNNGYQEYFGKIDIAYNDAQNGGVYLSVLNGGGAIKFHSYLDAGVTRISTASGLVSFDHAITVKIRDPNLRFDHEEDRGKLATPTETGFQGGILSIKSGGDVIFNPGAELGSQILTTHYKRDDKGQLYAVTDIVRAGNVQELNIITKEWVKFGTNVNIRDGGWLRVNAKNFDYKNITANNANIAITLTNNWADPYVDATGLRLDEHLSFSQAQSAYFDVAGDISVYGQINAKNLKLSAGQVIFDWNSSITSPDGSIVTLSQHKDYNGKNSDFQLNAGYWSHFKSLDGINLALETDGTIRIIDPILLGQDKNFTLTAPNIKINNDIKMNGGKLALIFTDSNKRHTVNLDQNVTKHLLFHGDANLEVRSDNNLNISGTLPKFNIADFYVSGKGRLAVNTPLSAYRHLGFYSKGSIVVSHPVAVDAGVEAVELLTPDDNKSVFFEKNGRVGE